MTPQILISLSTIFGVFIVLYCRRSAPTEVLFSGALGLLILCGIIEPERAWKSFANDAVIAIGGLLIVSAGLRTTGALDLVGRSLLGSVRKESRVLLRLSGVVIAGSAFLLNTAIVAMLLPQVVNWCRRRNVAPSKLLLPISYLAILGGTCTLVGTSTNLIVNRTLKTISRDLDTGSLANSSLSQADTQLQGSLKDLDAQWLASYQGSLRPMHLTEISAVGVPCALAGAVLLLLFGKFLVPNRTELLDSLDERRREYLVELMVTAECALIGKTVEEGGLRHLPGLFLIEIDRAGEVIAPVAPTDRIRENDRLVFTGVVSTIVDLEKIPGLVPAADINYEFASQKQIAARSLVEVVLSPSSPLVGSTIRNANFRRLYGAAVVAVHRNGARLPTKIGDIELASGDTLLLQTQPGFVRNFRNRPDFYLVSGVEDGDSRRHNRMFWAIAIVVGLIAWLLAMPLIPSIFGALFANAAIPSFATDPAAAIFVAAIGMIVTRCLPTREVRNAIDLPMLLTIGAAIGLGTAISDCGAAQWVADLIVGFVGDQKDSAYFGLIAVFILTVCFTEMISNAAVAALMITIAIGLACNLGVDPRPFIMAVTLGASLSFISPIGYQTNLMVMGPGGYRSIDYLRAGLPLTIVVGGLALFLIPKIWPF